MKRLVFLAIFAICIWIGCIILFTGCIPQEQALNTNSSNSSNPSSASENNETIVSSTYKQISQDEAKNMTEENPDIVIVDVRQQDEYDAGHIPNAILIPNESISTEKISELPDLDQAILIYCRSGRRSKEAAQKLSDIGYNNIYEFGGILDWTGEVVTETETP